MDTLMYIQITGDIVLMITLFFLMAKYYSTVKSLSKCTPENSNETVKNKTRYKEAAKLIEEGISGEDIARTLQIPTAEVKLIKNLKSL